MEEEIRFIIKELKKALKEKKEIFAAINKDNKATYRVNIGDCVGEIKIENKKID